MDQVSFATDPTDQCFLGILYCIVRKKIYLNKIGEKPEKSEKSPKKKEKSLEKSPEKSSADFSVPYNIGRLLAFLRRESIRGASLSRPLGRPAREAEKKGGPPDLWKSVGRPLRYLFFWGGGPYYIV